MKRLIPFIGNSKTPIRSSSMKHLGAFMSSVMALVGLLNVSYGTELLSIFGRIFHRVHAMLLGDPKSAIRLLKSAQVWYLGIVRGIKPNGAQPFDSDDDFFHSRDSSTAGRTSLLYLRAVVENKFPALLPAFDALVYSFLSLHRLIITPPVYGYTTITSPSKFDPKGEEVPSPSEILDALAKLGIPPSEFKAEFSRRCRDQKHILMSSSGPNGKGHMDHL